MSPSGLKPPSPAATTGPASRSGTENFNKYQLHQRFEEVLGRPPKIAGVPPNPLAGHSLRGSQQGSSWEGESPSSGSFPGSPPVSAPETASQPADSDAPATRNSAPARDDETLELPAFADPLARVLLAARPVVEASIATSPAHIVPSAVEAAVARLVRRIAWGGDGRRGTARIEFGAGELAGATLVVAADGAAVTIELEVPPGVDASSWRKRLGKRLAARGVQVESLEVR